MRDLLARLSELGLGHDVSIATDPGGWEHQTWLAIVSSRLGTETRRHVEACRYLRRAMIDASQTDAAILIARGSAIEPWVLHAARRLDVPVVRVHVTDGSGDDFKSRVAFPDPMPLFNLTVTTHLGGGNGGRDSVVIALADRVDCVYLRRNGAIDRAIRCRLKRDRNTIRGSQGEGHPKGDARSGGVIRVALPAGPSEKASRSAARAAMGGGALGWFCPSDLFPEPNTQQRTAPVLSDDWDREAGQWLVHCTRGCNGPWPGMNLEEHREMVLFPGDRSDLSPLRRPLDSLKRILRMQRLVASAVASDHRWPVICFSERGVRELIAGRTYRSHLHRWDCEPYGIAIRRSVAERLGVAPVIYGRPEEREGLAPGEQYRFQAVGRTYDWTQEREWRKFGDLDLAQLNREDIRAFVARPEDLCECDTTIPVTVLGTPGPGIASKVREQRVIDSAVELDRSQLGQEGRRYDFALKPPCLRS